MIRTFAFSLFLCLLSSLFSFTTTAQEYNSYDISKYYTPDIVRNQLDLTFSSAGSFNSSSNNSFNISTDNAIDGYLRSAFINYVNTRKMIRTINASLGFRGSSNGSDDLTSQLKFQSGNFDNGAGIGASYQLFNNANQFISFGGNFNYDYSSGHSDKTNTLNKADRTNSNRFYTSLYAYIGAGVGRIEIVTDAQQAIYMIDAFAKNKILSNVLSSNEIFSLSQEISRIKNKRFLDSRLHLIDEVSQVDSFFVANKLINKYDAKYFTTLYDSWLYGDKFERKSGSALELRFSPNMSMNNSYAKNTYAIITDSLSESKDYFSNSQYNLYLSYNYEKPDHQKWQHSVNAMVSFASTNYHSLSQDMVLNSTNNSSSESKIANALVSYKLGFYPDTRTNIFAQVSQNAEYNIYAASTFNGNIQVFNPNTLSLNSSLDCGMYYYFSPQLRLSATLNFSNVHNIQFTSGSSSFSNNLSSNFSVGVNYSIF